MVISHAQSIVNLCLAAAASTAMFGGGLLRARRRGRRWLWILGGSVGLAMTAYVADAELRGYQSVTPPSWLVVAVLAGLLVGASLLTLGLRGRYVGDHEHCRRCGFDLFGRPAGTQVCGECGAPLDAPKAIVVGVRHRRAIPLLLGLFALVLSFGIGWPLGRDAVAAARGYDWRRWWPQSWLVAELKSPTRADRERAFWSLSERFANGKLTPGSVAAVLDAATAEANAGGTSTRDSFFSALLGQGYSGWMRGVIDEPAMRGVMRATLAARLDVAPRAARGRILRHRILLSPYTTQFTTFSNRRDDLNGRPLGPATWSTLEQVGERYAIRDLGNALPLPADTPIGPATLTTRFTVTMTLSIPNRPTLVETADVTLTGTTTIVEPEAMRVPPPTTRPTGMPEVTIDRDPTTGDARLSIGVPPSMGNTAILADAFLRPLKGPDAGKERPLGPIFADRSINARIDVGPLPRTGYDLILRPRPDLAVELFTPVPTEPDEFLVPIPVGE